MRYLATILAASLLPALAQTKPQATGDWPLYNPDLAGTRYSPLTLPVLAQIGKSGWMFILNRETGKPVFGVEERPVAKGDAPGEWYSPTQPFPLKRPALARMSYKPEDLVTAEDTTPERQGLPGSGSASRRLL